MMRILIVEDEEHLADLLAEVLSREGHVANTASDGRSGLTLALSEDFDLLVVDWMLPDLDGVQVVKRVRAADVRVPILMLTARAQVEDRVEGLDAGADDYLPKPFAFPELLARVRALSRRPPENAPEEIVLTAGDVALDPVRHEVRRAGERVDLTAKEFALLATLMQRPGQVFTRSVLLDTVWDGTTGAYTNVVDLYIHYLRKKLDAGEEPSRIRTVHGRKERAMPRTSPYHIELTKDERDRLQASVRRYTSAYRDVTRAKIVLLAAEGMANDEIAARLGTPRQIVSK